MRLFRVRPTDRANHRASARGIAYSKRLLPQQLRAACSMMPQLQRPWPWTVRVTFVWPTGRASHERIDRGSYSSISLLSLQLAAVCSHGSIQANRGTHLRTRPILSSRPFGRLNNAGNITACRSFILSLPSRQACVASGNRRRKQASRATALWLRAWPVLLVRPLGRPTRAGTLAALRP